VLMVDPTPISPRLIFCKSRANQWFFSHKKSRHQECM